MLYIYMICYIHYNIMYVLYILYCTTSLVQLSTWRRLVYYMVLTLLLTYILNKFFDKPN